MGWRHFLLVGWLDFDIHWRGVPSIQQTLYYQHNQNKNSSNKAIIKHIHNIVGFQKYMGGRGDSDFANPQRESTKILLILRVQV